MKPAASIVAALVLAVSVASACADDGFAGKTVTIVVGFGPVGGYDLYARLLSRHLGEHLPGHPTVVVQTMEGAGGVRAANYVAAQSSSDGTVIAAVNQGAALFAILGGKGAAYDPAKLHWLGRLGSSNNTVYVAARSGVHTIADARLRDMTMAGSGIISDADIYPKILNAIAGTRFKIINGYAGTNESNLAIERGEVDGRGGGAYASLLATHPAWLRDGTVAILAQVGVEREPDLPNVPLLQELAATDDDKAIAAVASMPVAIGYNYWVASGVPEARVALLRAALDAAAHDPALLAEARSQNLDVRYLSGGELQDLVQRASATPKPVLARLKAILGW